MRAVAQKPHDAVVKFDTYRNLQRHRTVLPAIARHLAERRWELKMFIIIVKKRSVCSTEREECKKDQVVHFCFLLVGF